MTTSAHIKLRTEIEAEIYGYRVYADDHGGCDSYIARCNIHKYGDVGIVYGMLGSHLLESLADDMINGCLKDLGFKSLEGYIIKPVARAIRFMKNNRPINVEFTKSCEQDGRKFNWVVMTAK